MAEFDRFAPQYKSALDRSIAFSGEASEYFTDYKAAYIQQLLGPTHAASRILDFGCGVGVLSSALSRRLTDAKIDGYDVSTDSLDQVEPALRSRGVFTARLDELRDDYSLIVLSNVMHHILPAARPATINDLAARLAPAGRLLVIEHNPLNPMTRWVVGRCEFDDDAILLRPSELKRYFAAAGLRDPRRDYIVFFPKFLARLRRFESFLGWCPAGAQYAICATKAE